MTARTATGSARTGRSYRNRRLLAHGALYAVALAVLAVIIVPILFAVIGGFRTTGQIAFEPAALPDPWIFSNYGRVLTMGAFWRQMLNSLVIAGITTVVLLPAASMAAFVISRFRFRGREGIYWLFTVGLLFPLAVAILPLYIVIRQIGLLSSPLGVALPQAAFALPLSIVVLRPFFRSIPRELEEAAAIDGCGPFRFYWSILLPLSRPVLSTIAVLTIVGSWNAFLLPLVVLVEPTWWTLPLGVTTFSDRYTSDIAGILAFTTLSMVPALVLYVIAERQIVAGLSGGVKG